MLKGSCLCGTVRYEVTGELGPIRMCHCSTCRKASGTAFTTNCDIKPGDFRLVQGSEALREFESSPGVFRTFCGKCGSPIYKRLASKPGEVRLRIGTLDTPIGQRPCGHIFVASKAEWFEIHDDLPQYAQRP